MCNNADEGILVFGNGSWVIDNRAYNNGSDGLDADIVDDVLFYGNVSTKNSISGLEVDAVWSCDDPQQAPTTTADQA